jgi:flagella basal body P-ring formation protein FlgA
VVINVALRRFLIVFAAAMACATAFSAVVRSEGGRAAAAATGGAIGAAIERAVAERIGRGVHVSVATLQTAVSATESVVASPEPGARTGAPARFTLFVGGSRVGSAVATVHVTGTHVRARRALGRDEPLTAGDVQEIDGPLGGQPLKRLPSLADVLGARLRRNVAAGEAITAAVIEVPAVVKSGDVVSATVRIGAVEAEGKAVAQGSGQVGDIVRVVPGGTRRLLRARITGPGQVEILQ